MGKLSALLKDIFWWATWIALVTFIWTYPGGWPLWARALTCVVTFGFAWISASVWSIERKLKDIQKMEKIEQIKDE
jgi:hypothetical protein